MITALPTPPLRSDGPTTFADRGDAFVAALPVFVTEANALEENVNSAEASATNSASSAAGAATAAGATIWVSGTTYAIGNARFSPVDFQTYRRKTAGAGTTDPSLDATNWARVNLGANSITRSTRTSNTILGVNDRSALIDITSGTFSQTLTAAATLTAGWWCWIRNSGTGTITLDPNASELIDGAATLTLAPGFAVLVTCSGLAFTTLLIAPFVGDHVVTVETGNGWGSTNTKIRRYTTTQVNTGTAITYADSATLGASFTINQHGLYEIHSLDTGGSAVGASVNSAQLTTNISSITGTNRICWAATYAASQGSVTRTARLSVGDVVRPHAYGDSTNTVVGDTLFSIRKVGV